MTGLNNRNFLSLRVLRMLTFYQPNNYQILKDNIKCVRSFFNRGSIFSLQCWYRFISSGMLHHADWRLLPFFRVCLTLKKEVIYFSETKKIICHSTWRNKPEKCNIIFLHLVFTYPTETC